jgi:hypothetical protein
VLIVEEDVGFVDRVWDPVRGRKLRIQRQGPIGHEPVAEPFNRVTHIA